MKQPTFGCSGLTISTIRCFIEKQLSFFVQNEPKHFTNSKDSYKNGVHLERTFFFNSQIIQLEHLPLFFFPLFFFFFFLFSNLKFFFFFFFFLFFKIYKK